MCARSLWGFALKALALEAIAKEQTLSGRLDLAFESYVLIEPTDKERSQALLAIVETQAKAGQWAKPASRRLKSGLMRVWPELSPPWQRRKLRAGIGKQPQRSGLMPCVPSRG